MNSSVLFLFFGCMETDKKFDVESEPEQQTDDNQNVPGSDGFGSLDIREILTDSPSSYAEDVFNDYELGINVAYGAAAQ